MNTLIKYLLNIESEKEGKDFLQSLFSPEEIEVFEKRINIVKLLLKNKPHRKIASELNVGIATVTRGAKELKLGRFKFLNK
jgi:TrpR family trp operon transcriptional repressor